MHSKRCPLKQILLKSRIEKNILSSRPIREYMERLIKNSQSQHFEKLKERTMQIFNSINFTVTQILLFTEGNSPIRQLSTRALGIIHF